ncbi:MAG: hypothetical protein JXA14_21735 [Anaerolineae bacterium]|nr:hypothetical protein [Anaerolineae bacterium]
MADLVEPEPGEDLNPRHFYAAYVFHKAHERQSDVAALVEQARELGYPVRYWWLSEAMHLGGGSDRLIVCVHHPSWDADAGMDLYNALRRQGVDWNALEAAAFSEYLCLGKPIKGPKAICKPDRTPLFPQATE